MMMLPAGHSEGCHRESLAATLLALFSFYPEADPILEQQTDPEITAFVSQPQQTRNLGDNEPVSLLHPKQELHRTGDSQHTTPLHAPNTEHRQIFSRRSLL